MDTAGTILALIGVVFAIVLSIMLILAPLKLFSIDKTLKQILKEIQALQTNQEK